MMVPPVVEDLGDALHCVTCGEVFDRDWRHYHASIKGSPRIVMTHPASCTCGVCRAVPCTLHGEPAP